MPAIQQVVMAKNKNENTKNSKLLSLTHVSVICRQKVVWAIIIFVRLCLCMAFSIVIVVVAAARVAAYSRHQQAKCNMRHGMHVLQFSNVLATQHYEASSIFQKIYPQKMCEDSG